MEMSFFILPIVLLTLFLIVGIFWFTPELRANYFLWRGNEHKARKLFEYLLNQNPEKLNLYRKLAQIYYMGNRRDKKALKIFEIILKLKIPFEWKDEILPVIAKHYIIEGRKDSEAIKLIEKAVDKELENLNR